MKAREARRGALKVSASKIQNRLAERKGSTPFHLDIHDHAVSEEADELCCDACWSGYPKLCETPECNGLVHASFEDENWDGYWLYTRCDRCGESE